MKQAKPNTTDKQPLVGTALLAYARRCRDLVLEQPYSQEHSRLVDALDVIIDLGEGQL